MMPEARSAGARVQTSCVYQGCSACFLPACWWPLPFFFVVEATGELGGFSESQLMAHHILNFVEAAHSLCGVEVSPQWFSLNPNWGGSKRRCPLGSSHPIQAPAPCSGVLKPTSYCSSVSALPETVLVNGVGVERSWLTLRGPLIKILKRPSKNMSAVTCTSCACLIFFMS